MAPPAGSSADAYAFGWNDLVFVGGLEVYDMSGILHESGHIIDAWGSGQTDNSHQSSRKWF